MTLAVVFCAGLAFCAGMNFSVAVNDGKKLNGFVAIALCVYSFFWGYHALQQAGAL